MIFLLLNKNGTYTYLYLNLLMYVENSITYILHL